MTYKTMTFSRSSSGYNAENGDYLDFEPDSSLSFGSLYKCTDFYVEITGGITSATTSGRTHEMKLQIKLGSTWRTIWSGEQYLPAKGTTGYEITFSGTIPSSYQVEAATNGIKDIRLQQAGDFALRGTNASGSIQVTYVDNITICGVPSNVALSAAQTVDSATLSWSAGSAGINNSVTGYLITYQDSTDGSTWGEVAYYGETSSTSLTVNAPSTVGHYRRFGVQTKGSAGENYYSYVVWSGALKKITYTACGAPTACSVSSTLATGNVTLSWSGSTAGTANTISSYEVQRAESSDGSTWGSWVALTIVTTTATSGSVSVAPPTTAGNYYKFRVRTRGSAGASYYSGWKESTNTLRRNWTACGAPTSCAVDSTLSLVATTLRWSGATAGYGNTISKYEVQRRSQAPGGSWSAWSAFETTSGTSLSVSPPATAGHYYQYRVRAQGTAGEAYYSGWKESTNTLRKAHKTIPAFTDPTLIVGQTDVKAIHITELQSVMNDILLPFMGMNAATFTKLERDSDAKYWGAHVQEIKVAIDSTGFSHEAWVTMQDEVTADVIEQLRRIVKSM